MSSFSPQLITPCNSYKYGCIIIITAFANISCHAAILKVVRSPRLCLFKRFICSPATPHQLPLSTSSILAATTFFFSEDTKMSLFSSKSVRQGSNQRLSFLGKPQAFLRKAPALSAFMFSYAFCLGSLS